MQLKVTIQVTDLEKISTFLLKNFDGDKSRVRELGRGCKAIGFPIAENVRTISDNWDYFLLLITYSELGILGKLADTLDKLKQK